MSFRNFEGTLLPQSISYSNQMSKLHIFLALYKRGFLIFSGFKYTDHTVGKSDLLHKNSKHDNILISTVVSPSQQ